MNRLCFFSQDIMTGPVKRRPSVVCYTKRKLNFSSSIFPMTFSKVTHLSCTGQILIFAQIPKLLRAAISLKNFVHSLSLSLIRTDSYSCHKGRLMFNPFHSSVSKGLLWALSPKKLEMTATAHGCSKMSQEKERIWDSNLNHSQLIFVMRNIVEYRCNEMTGLGDIFITRRPRCGAQILAERNFVVSKYYLQQLQWKMRNRCKKLTLDERTTLFFRQIEHSY